MTAPDPTSVPSAEDEAASISGGVPSVIIPAHNEERVLGRLLDGLLADARPGEFEVLVVSNGSVDATARVAARPGVTVLEISEASKYLALRAGDAVACGFPRVYLDADVELDTDGLRALVAALAEPGVLAVAPERVMSHEGSAWAVRAYYRVWEQLPAVREGLTGRGVLAVDAVGFARIADRPDVIGDDLYLHSCFTDTERRIVRASRSVVRGPRTVADLLRRRTRAAQANAQLGARTGAQTVTTTSSAAELARLAVREPGLLPSLTVFVAITLAGRIRARWRARTGRSDVWLRDESSRA
jgi:hypothetical protein